MTNTESKSHSDIQVATHKRKKGRKPPPMVSFEALSPKVLRDSARAANWPESRVARLNSYYFALIQLKQLRGNGACLHNGLIRDFSGIGEDDQMPFRLFLEQIGLLQVDTQRQSGGRFFHWYRLLRVPRQEHRFDPGKPERNQVPVSADLDLPAAASDDLNGDVEEEKEHEGSDSLVVPTNVATTNKSGGERIGDSANPALVAAWLSENSNWNREDILEFLRDYPSPSFVDGVTSLHLVARAIQLIPGAAAFIAEVGGWEYLLELLPIRFNDCIGTVWKRDYRYLIDAALGMSEMPGPNDEARCTIGFLDGLNRTAIELKMEDFQSD